MLSTVPIKSNTAATPPHRTRFKDDTVSSSIGVRCKPMVAPGGSARITQMGDFSVVLGSLGRDTIHEGYGGHPLRRGHASPGELAHPRETTLPIGVRVLLEGQEPQPRAG